MKIKFLDKKSGYADAKEVRIAVFVDEQKFALEAEMDDKDDTCVHVVVYSDENEPVGTGRFFIEPDGTYHVGRIAVVKKYRGTGLGRVVMEALEEKADEMGGKRLFLGAQETAVGFYETLGYKVCGEMYMDEHTQHYPMEKHL